MGVYENHSEDVINEAMTHVTEERVANMVSEEINSIQPTAQHEIVTNAASSNNIPEGLICSICLEEYDNGIKKPKRLPCYHTVCLLCLMVLHYTYFNMLLLTYG